MWPNHLYVQSVTNIPVDNLCIVVSNAGKKGKCSLMCHTQIAGGRSNNPLLARSFFSPLYHPREPGKKNLFFLISYIQTQLDGAVTNTMVHLPSPLGLYFRDRPIFKTVGKKSAPAVLGRFQGLPDDAYFARGFISFDIG